MDIIQSIIPNLFYDLFKMTLSFIFARYLYEYYIMDWFWGGWKIIINDSDKLKTERAISSATFKRINSDLTELSIYTKGVISPFCYLKIDIVSPEAEELGLIRRDKENKRIIINIGIKTDNDNNLIIIDHQ